MKCALFKHVYPLPNEMCAHKIPNDTHFKGVPKPGVPTPYQIIGAHNHVCLKIPPFTHLEDGWHGAVEVLVSVCVCLLQLQDVCVTAVLSSLLLLP